MLNRPTRAGFDQATVHDEVLFEQQICLNPGLQTTRICAAEKQLKGGKILQRTGMGFDYNC